MLDARPDDQAGQLVAHTIKKTGIGIRVVVFGPGALSNRRQRLGTAAGHREGWRTMRRRTKRDGVRAFIKSVVTGSRS